MKFTIERSKWRNSHHGKGPTKLLNKEHYQCCLGFCCEQIGVPKHQLMMIGSPDSILKFNKTFDMKGILTTGSMCGGLFGNSNSVLSTRAIRINDSTDIGLEEKESRLIKLFSDCGHELEFVGDYEIDS